MNTPNLQQQQLIQQKVLAFQQSYTNTIYSEDSSIKVSFNGILEIIELKILGKIINGQLETKLLETINLGLKQSGNELKNSVQIIAKEVML